MIDSPPAYAQGSAMPDGASAPVESTPTARRWRRRADARPAEILDAALDVFAQKGYAAARLEDVAQAAGVSKAAIYLYFADKAALLRAVIADTRRESIEAAQSLLASAPGGAMETLAKVLSLVQARILETKRAAIPTILAGAAGQFPELARYYHDEIVEPGFALLEALIARGQKRGEVRLEPPRALAQQIVGPMLFALFHRTIFEPAGARPLDLDRFVQDHLAAIGRVLAPDPAAI